MQEIGAIRLGRLLACLLLQVGLMLASVMPGHAATLPSTVAVVTQPMADMPGMQMPSRADTTTAHCNHEPCHDHHPCHHCGDCCAQGACVANWLMPPSVTRAFDYSGVTAPFGLSRSDRIVGHGFAPALPPPRQMA
ncbi:MULTISPECIES: hypothetical protein [Acetobacteraceae]|uniref:hypothetical protein n=1 Tax=Acetobacteraceae TaxID=433 RepID=UPI001F380B49|nr:hypothetical protein [Acetobacter aceti]